MSLFSSFETSRTVPVTVDDLTPVVQDLMEHFRRQEYEVASNQKIGGGWRVDITKGELFATLVGTKTALNIDIEPVGDSTQVKASVGLFDLQAIPTVLMLFVFTPVIIGQIIGLVQQEKLDNEAVDVTEQALRRHAMIHTPPPTPPPAPSPLPEEQEAERELKDYLHENPTSPI
jgi:hypothetical protein